MDHERLVIARGDGHPRDLSQFDGRLLPQLVAAVQAVEVEVAEDVDSLVRLHGSAEFGDVGGVEAIIVLVNGLVAC